MPDKTTYLPGEPTWADLSSSDVEASRAFYGALFGWTAPPAQEEFGGYANFELGGRKVCGLMPLMDPRQPVGWSCYVSTADAEKTTALVTESGGTVVAPPMSVGPLGTMAVYLDPQGTFFGVWQPAEHIGAERWGDEGTLSWFELTTRDPDPAVDFYGRVFGWTDARPEGYIELQLQGTSVAGCLETPPSVPADAPSTWMPYFGVADPAGKAEQAAGLGATVLVAGQEFPGGTFSVVRDPQGATFGLLSLMT
jgi:predicted enzyme related to lactoylglutathione lyase